MVLCQVYGALTAPEPEAPQAYMRPQIYYNVVRLPSAQLIPPQSTTTEENCNFLKSHLALRLVAVLSSSIQFLLCCVFIICCFELF